MCMKMQFSARTQHAQQWVVFTAPLVVPLVSTPITISREYESPAPLHSHSLSSLSYSLSLVHHSLSKHQEQEVGGRIGVHAKQKDYGDQVKRRPQELGIDKEEVLSP